MRDSVTFSVFADLHFAPGGRENGSETRMFHDERLAAHFVETWRRIAERFRGREGIYGYDLVNEPMQTSEAAPGCDFWTLQKRAAEAIREIDPDTPILVECNSQDDPAAFASFSPLDLVNVIYEVHMYKPLAYTHQGVMWKQGELRSYPDDTKGWNKDYLRACLKPVRDFQLRHGAKIYAGEFSAVAWAPAPTNTSATASTSSRNMDGTGPTTPSANRACGTSNGRARVATRSAPPPPTPRASAPCSKACGGSDV